MGEICKEYHLRDLTSRVLYPISVGILAGAQKYFDKPFFKRLGEKMCFLLCFTYMINIKNKEKQHLIVFCHFLSAKKSAYCHIVSNEL